MMSSFSPDRSEKKDINEERLQKIVIEASEQCGRGDIPVILPVTELSSLTENLPTHDLLLVSQMGGESLHNLGKVDKATNIALFVGPEGGWSPAEIEHFKVHNIPVYSLGDHILRAETAAMAIASLLLL